MTTATEASTQARRVELILRQIDSLPTLPTIATRLLTLTASDDTHAREVIELVSSDPTLTGKILSMCRKADRGVRENIMTVDKAVVLLGFNAIRNAALSIKVFEIFEEATSTAQSDTHGGNGAQAKPHHRFNHHNFWRHSLAVGIAAELIATAHPHCSDLPASEAFVCGLMHDVGKLALDYVLPKSYARVVELTEINQANIAEYEQKIMGLDHHTAGKRLSEQWLLPYWIQDCIWLHGSDYQTLPRLGHRRMIGLISLADLVVRRHHIGYSGNFPFEKETAQLARELELNPNAVDSITRQLHDEVQTRSEVLGLDEQPSRELFLQSIQQANLVLGRLNSALDRRTKTAARQAKLLESITAFQTAESAQSRTAQDVLNAVVASATEILGAGYYGVLYQPNGLNQDEEDLWLFNQYNEDAALVRTEYIQPTAYSPRLSTLGEDHTMSMNLMGILPWIADYLLEPQDPRDLHLLPLRCCWGTAAALLHRWPALPPLQQLNAVTSCWGAAIGAARQYEGSRELSEQLAQTNRALAEANRKLAETQEKLLEAESMARLGEMAAGAAHEMNNPLTVISGRSQLLVLNLPPGSKEQIAAQTIVDQTQRLSDLISSLRMFADPPRPKIRPTDVTLLLDAAVKSVKNRLRTFESKTPISLKCKAGLGLVPIDPHQIGHAVTDLLVNAMQASPKTAVHVMAYLDRKSGDLVIRVTDDGKGMDEYTLLHARDPFYSAKPAGRQMGMGLTRAQLYIAGHNGHLDLRSTPNAGTVATVIIPLDLA